MEETKKISVQITVISDKELIRIWQDLAKEKIE